jgi:glycine betaine/proline transport system permease protein/glycine betaine/proline transport system substrate-binding protein
MEMSRKRARAILSGARPISALALLAALALAALPGLAGCSGSSSSGGAGAGSGGIGEVVFMDAGWDSNKFHNAVAMFIAKEAYGAAPSEVSGTTAVTYNALLKGDVQVCMEMWSDNLPTYQDDLAAGRLAELALNFGDNAQGLYVPRYVIEGDPERGIEAAAPGLARVEDLAGYSQVFPDPDDAGKGRIYGAISGWEVDQIMRNKYVYYGLDAMYNYMDPGSDAALAAAISGAYEKGEPIVAYYWEPTWITGKYDLVLLEDAPYDAAKYHTGQCACPSVRVVVCVNAAFQKAQPEFCEFLGKYETSSALTAEALLYLQETGDTYEGAAKWFLKGHDELVSAWLPQDKQDLVRAALEGA